MNLGESNHYNRLIFNQNPDVNYREWLLDLLENRNGDANPRNLETQRSFLKNQDGFVKMDFIGRFESLTEDFRELCSMLNINVPLKHFNQSTQDSSNFRDWFDLDSRARLESYFKEDFNYFGYVF